MASFPDGVRTISASCSVPCGPAHPSAGHTRRMPALHDRVQQPSTGNLAALGEFDEDLFLKLKELRNELAREAGIPAYAVFHNSTLEGLARLKPTTRRGAMNVHGIGEQKAARYLDDFLEVIAEHCGV